MKVAGMFIISGYLIQYSISIRDSTLQSLKKRMSSICHLKGTYNIDWKTQKKYFHFL